MKSKVQIYILLLIILGSFGSCITYKDTDLLQDIPKEYSKVLAEDYRIIPGDMLTVSIYTLDDDAAALFSNYRPALFGSNNTEATGANTSEVRSMQGLRNSKPINVYADGTINFPYIGDIPVEGLTVFEVRKLLNDKLSLFAQGTTADVVLYNNFFSILGESGATRIIMPSEKVTILQALSLGGSLSNYADRTKVSILRQTKDGTEKMTFDLRSKDIINSEYYYIQANDVIYFPQTNKRFLGGTNSFAGMVGLVTSLLGTIVLLYNIF